MVRKRQRRKTLARDRWERQQQQRETEEARRRKISLVIGAIVGLLAVAALIWLIVHLVNAENDRSPAPAPGSTAPQTTLPTLPTTLPSPTGVTAPSDSAGTTGPLLPSQSGTRGPDPTFVTPDAPRDTPQDAPPTAASTSGSEPS